MCCREAAHVFASQCINPVGKPLILPKKRAHSVSPCSMQAPSRSARLREDGRDVLGLAFAQPVSPNGEHCSRNLLMTSTTISLSGIPRSEEHTSELQSL